MGSTWNIEGVAMVGLETDAGGDGVHTTGVFGGVISIMVGVSTSAALSGGKSGTFRWGGRFVTGTGNGNGNGYGNGWRKRLVSLGEGERGVEIIARMFSNR